MATKAYYPVSEIGAGKVGFSKTRSIIEAAFYGNNVVKVNTLREAYELAKNSPGTVVTDMPVKDGETFGLPAAAKVLLFNDGAVTGRGAAPSFQNRGENDYGFQEDPSHSAGRYLLRRSHAGHRLGAGSSGVA